MIQMLNTKTRVSAAYIFLINGDKRHEHRLTAKNVIFGLEWLLNVSVYKNYNLEKLTQEQYFFYHIWPRESEKHNVTENLLQNILTTLF